MSPTGALLVALSAILVLGAFAAWLLNIPLWAIAAFLVGGILVIRRIFRRLPAARARQEAEGPKQGV
jgi:hypothetical protein